MGASSGHIRVLFSFSSSNPPFLQNYYLCLQIWEIAKKRTRNIFREHTDAITDLDFSPNSRFLVSSSYDRTVRIWRMRDGFSKLLEDQSASLFYSVRFNPDGRYIAAGNTDGMLRIWNVRMSQLVEKWTAHEDVVWSVAFTPDGKGLVSSSGDGTWKYWDITLLDSGCGTTKDSTVRQKSKVPAHTVRYSHVPIQLFLLTLALLPTGRSQLHFRLS